MKERSHIEEKVEWFIGKCKHYGMKITPQRVAIYRELASTDEHPSAETIYNRIKRYYPNVSLTTIYRTLETFERHGLISVVNTLYNAARYDANIDHHTHLVCVVCKKLEDIYDDTLSGFDFSGKTDYKILGYKLLINGICSECQKRSL
jgi:Fur family peroxide stress response transcriptional regulator